jgi:pyridoxal 5'-phosphate synthase subunit Pdx1
MLFAASTNSVWHSEFPAVKVACCCFLSAQGEAGTGNVVEAVRHARAVMGAIRQLQSMDDDELYVYAKEIKAPVELVRQTKHLGRLPVVNFAAGGVATPADAALMMQLGMDGVFVGSGIFKSGDPSSRARAIVQVRPASGHGLWCHVQRHHTPAQWGSLGSAAFITSWSLAV